MPTDRVLHRIEAVVDGNFITTPWMDLSDDRPVFIDGVPYSGSIEDAIAYAKDHPRKEGPFDYFCGRCGHKYGHFEHIMPYGVSLEHVCPFCDRCESVRTYCRECGGVMPTVTSPGSPKGWGYETIEEHQANPWHRRGKAERPDPNAPYDPCLG